MRATNASRSGDVNASAASNLSWTSDQRFASTRVSLIFRDQALAASYTPVTCRVAANRLIATGYRLVEAMLRIMTPAREFGHQGITL